MCPKPYPKSLTCHSSPVSDLSESSSTGLALSDAPVRPDVEPAETSRGESDPNWNVTSRFVWSTMPPMPDSPAEAEPLVVRAFRNFLPLTVTNGPVCATPTVKEGSRGSRGVFPALPSVTLTTSSGLRADVFVLSSVSCGRMCPKISGRLGELADKVAATSR